MFFFCIRYVASHGRFVISRLELVEKKKGGWYVLKTREGHVKIEHGEPLHKTLREAMFHEIHYVMQERGDWFWKFGYKGLTPCEESRKFLLASLLDEYRRYVISNPDDE